MDGRWHPFKMDSKRDARVILHPTAGIHDVRRGLDPGSDDSIDLSEFVKNADHTAFEANVTLAFNRELFGAKQPAPNHVLEIQLYQSEEWKPVWIGHIEAISSFSMQRGERQMQLSAKTREQRDIWKNTPRVTPLFPQLTNLTYMAQYIARIVEMKMDEIVLPPSAITTAHANTQLADMTAWEMISAIFVALGWTPFIDGLGRLRAADRGLQGRIPDIILSDERMVKVGGQRARPPINRVTVTWLDPVMKKWKQQGRMLHSETLTLGWWKAKHTVKVKFSEDGSQRAEDTTLRVIDRIDKLWKFVEVDWDQKTAATGELVFNNYKYVTAMAMEVIIWAWHAKHAQPDGVKGTVPVAIGTPTNLYFMGGVGGGPVYGNIVATPPELTTVPTGRMLEAAEMLSLMLLFMNAGTGTYEIWGTPYDFVHAKNVSEAFDSSVPTWVNNVKDVQCDFVANEAHAESIAVRELIYEARSANKWSVTVVDDPSVEYGDIVQFPDGSQLFVEDFNRSLERGSEATLEIKGFLVGTVKGNRVESIPEPTRRRA